MNSFTLIGLILLALVATGAYFYGTRKNKWIVSSVTKEIESVLEPLNSNYVNIGGSIGYNFTYAMKPPYSNAKGTLTLSPRHSLLYRPISLLLGIRDRFFINVFTKRKIRGEGHVIERTYFKHIKIDGSSTMERKEVQRDNKNFVLLWNGPDISSDLEKVLEAVPDASRFRHFCAYPENKTFFIHIQPQEGQIKANLEAIFKKLPLFMVKEKE